MALVCTAAVVGVLFGGGVFAAPEPEEPAPAPTVQPEPEKPSPLATTLMVHTTVLTEQPRSGSEVKAQVWVTATGAPADNVTLLLDAAADTVLTPRCTLAPAAVTTCRLGTLDAQGVAIPLVLRAPPSTAARAIALTATAAAAPALPAQLTTTIDLAPAVAAPKPTKTTRSPRPTKTTRSPKPTKTTSVPQPTGSPAAPVVPPPVSTTGPAAPNPTPYTPSPFVTPSSTSVLPQITPDPANTFPNENVIIAPPSSPPASPLSLTPVSSTLTAAHGLWLGALLTAIITALLLARRTRGRRPALIGRRRKTKSRSRHRRYTPQDTRPFDGQAAHSQIAELPAALGEPPPWPVKTSGDAGGAGEIEAVHESLQHFKAIRVTFNESETAASAQTRIVKKRPAGNSSPEFNEPASETLAPPDRGGLLPLGKRCIQKFGYVVGSTLMRDEARRPLPSTRDPGRDCGKGRARAPSRLQEWP